jgi:ABC-2 type transport system ATP-binding protein
MIKIQNISKSFNGQIVVDNLTLEAKTGEIVGLLGANGAGKSTTINMLLGFLHPENGTIHVDGIDSKNNFKNIRKVIGYVPENVNLYPYLSGIENLDYFCKLNNTKYNLNQLEQILIECG